MRALPVFVVSASLLVLGPALSGCGRSGIEACGPSSCKGCCDTAGRCLLGSTQEACGQTGGACVTCAQQEICQLGTCVPLQQGSDDGGGAQDAGSSDGGQDDGGTQDGGPHDGGMLDGGGCAGALTDCGGSCVDITTHLQHCGGCNQPCSTTCVGGICQHPPDCRTGTLVCGPNEYCDTADGACKPGCGVDTDCPQPGSCDLGTHTCVCAPGHNLCGGVCVADTAQSCGPACQPCPPPGANAAAVCTDGSCGSACIPGFILVNGVCVNECQLATTGLAPFGCDFWAVVQDSMVALSFRGGTTSGQGTIDSAFGFLIANTSASSVTVQVTRHLNNVVTQVKSVTIAAGGQVTVQVPWQSITGPSTTLSGSTGSGTARYGYRLQSTGPVMVWMFNVLSLSHVQGTCISNSDCTAGGAADCNKNVCQYRNATSDSSLLLPAHGLGTSYVVVSNEHAYFNHLSVDDVPGTVTIVATEDGTQVTVTSRAQTRAGPGVASLAKGQTATYTLNSYDVLQLVTDHISGSDISCVPSPFDPNYQVCRVDNDLSGSVITATTPVAVFGGASCALRPFNVVACDHLAEQLPPASTWGKGFVAVRSHPVRVSSGAFATSTAAAADLYKLVAVCPQGQCPSGTLVTFSTPPASADVFLPNRCLSGSLSTNDCRLPSGAAMEFRSKASFTLSSDFPISVTHFLTGAGATSQSAQGDPSMILLAPAEQWPESLVVMASPAFPDNYLSLAYDSANTSGVQVNGVAVTGFNAVTGTTYMVKAHPVPGGRLLVQALPKPGSTSPPRVGATVYGFAEYVSYGSAAGQRLLPNGSGITP
jgi:hypothetical protein